MGTQQEQIKGALRAYIMELNNPKDAMSTQRFAVYLDSGNGLEILWPSDSSEGKKSKELTLRQVYSTNRKYPAYHFALSGCGYSKTADLAHDLRSINPNIAVFTLNGCSPAYRS